MAETIAIHSKDAEAYGCPYCGCELATLDAGVQGSNFRNVICAGCKKHYIILGDWLDETPFEIGYNGESPHRIHVSEHPRKGIPATKYSYPDIRPINGEYWRPRGVGYPDVSGFVESPMAGERILDIVKEVTGKEEPKSWLDYRPHEPFWIQFKFHRDEFDCSKLDRISKDNGGIITKDIIKSCYIN